MKIIENEQNIIQIQKMNKFITQLLNPICLLKKSLNIRKIEIIENHNNI